MNFSRIKINTESPRMKTAPELYGLFFEDINHAADGGLYPEMIRNRAFEDSLPPEDCALDPAHLIYINEGGWPGVFNHGEGMDEWAAAVPETEIPAWYADNAGIELLTDQTLNRNRKAALKTVFRKNGSIRNIGYCGMYVQAGEKYDFYAFVRNTAETVLTLKLVSAAGELLGESSVRVPVSEEFIRIDAVLTAEKECSDASLIISSAGETVTVFGFTSLLPEKTFMGHGLREDLAIALKDTHSKFIRFPGGCVVEGINEKNTLKFSKTIGPVWERPSAQLMWHYRTTNGLGFHEYLQLCEDLGMYAMYVANCGMSCQARHGKGFAQEIVDDYLQEALHALDYALGGTDTEYGAMRAAAGHPEPFPLKYLEIGNENFGPEYNERYEKFYQTLKAAYPDVIYIANNHTEDFGLPAEVVDEHYYNTPEFFLENVNQFDDYDRKGPDIFVGEYAVNGGNTIASMECALAEAAFLIGMEQNQDIVKLSAYAPLFQNLDYTAWKPNLIVFNNHEVYGIPSYHAISMLAKYRGEQVLETQVDAEKQPPCYYGIPGLLCEKEGLLFKNAKVNGVPVKTGKQLYGDVAEVGDGLYTIRTGEDRHRYLGKNGAWNQAFEDFIHSGDYREHPILWTLFDSLPEREYTFEIDLKFDRDNPVVISVLNRCADTDAGCNEPKDHTWNRRNVRNEVWKLDNGVSSIRVPRIFEKPVLESETVKIDMDYSVFHTYRMEVRADGYDCYLDGKLIQTKNYIQHALLNAVAVDDGNEIILKLVHIGEEPMNLTVECGCEIEAEIRADVMTAEMTAVNSFENKTNAAAREVILNCGAKSFEYVVPAHTVAVLRMKKKGTE